MSEQNDENSSEETETESHKIVETNIVGGKKTVHEEEETKKKIKTEKNVESNGDKIVEEKITTEKKAHTSGTGY
ncbi:MAG: hypothetical protein WCW44_02955 [archaeon]|jgi:hypothetical protein